MRDIAKIGRLIYKTNFRGNNCVRKEKKEAEKIGDGIEEEIPEPFFSGFRPAATMPSQVALFPSLLRALSNLFDCSVSD